MRTHTKELLLASWPAAFSYDHEHGLFTSGAAQYTPTELPLGFGDLAAIEEPRELPDTALVQTVLHTVMLPRMYDWLQDNASQALFRETAEVMHDVFTTLQPDMLGKVARHDAVGLWGFNVSRIRDEHPHITLSTLGNCACYGVSLEGVFGQRYWNDKVAEFSFHNVDFPPQRISLLAGLGHIAQRANSSHQQSHLF